LPIKNIYIIHVREKNINPTTKKPRLGLLKIWPNFFNSKIHIYLFDVLGKILMSRL
jgi:hypothetical protein